jgi:threonine aldolase
VTLHRELRKWEEVGSRFQNPLETNIVRFQTPGNNALTLATALREREVMVISTGPESIRAVTHLDVTTADIDRAIEVFMQVMGQ